MSTKETAPRRGTRGSYAKSEQTRRMIIDSALEVFAESGYRQGSLKAVANRVGITDAGLLHHFRTKSDLLGAVFLRCDEDYQDQFVVKAGHGREWLESLIGIAEFKTANPSTMELFCTLSTEATSKDHPAHDYFVRRYQLTREAATSAFEDLRLRGELRDGVDPESAARSVIALMDGLQVQWLLERSSVDIPSDLRRYLNSLLVNELLPDAKTPSDPLNAMEGAS